MYKTFFCKYWVNITGAVPVVQYHRLLPPCVPLATPQWVAPSCYLPPSLGPLTPRLREGRARKYRFLELSNKAEWVFAKSLT